MDPVKPADCYLIYSVFMFPKLNQIHSKLHFQWHPLKRRFWLICFLFFAHCICLVAQNVGVKVEYKKNEPSSPHRIALVDYVRIRFKNSTTNLADENILRIHPNATEGFDGQLEAYKLDGGGPNLAMLVDDIRLAIQAIPFLGDLRLVPLEIKSPQSGNFSFEFENLTTFLGPNHEMFLRDNLLGTLEPVDSVLANNFTISQDPATQGKYRFELMIKLKEPTLVSPLSSSCISLFPNPSGRGEKQVILSGISFENARMRIWDLKGNLVFEKSELPIRGKFAIPFSPSAGFYFLRVDADKRSWKGKWVVK